MSNITYTESNDVELFEYLNYCIKREKNIRFGIGTDDHNNRYGENNFSAVNNSINYIAVASDEDDAVNIANRNEKAIMDVIKNPLKDITYSRLRNVP